jgi:hypothetical protein
LIFYSSNRFNLVDSDIKPEASDLEAFLDFLSPDYASLLSYISISFPALHNGQGQSEGLKLSPDGMLSLKLLQTFCTKLKILELAVHPGNSFGLVENSIHRFQAQGFIIKG